MKKFLYKLFGRKYYCMLPADRLTALKHLSKDLKDEIQKHHTLDPKNIDDEVNAKLFGLLWSVLDVIDQIEKHHNTKF